MTRAVWDLFLLFPQENQKCMCSLLILNSDADTFPSGTEFFSNWVFGFQMLLLCCKAFVLLWPGVGVSG